MTLGDPVGGYLDFGHFIVFELPWFAGEALRSWNNPRIYGPATWVLWSEVANAAMDKFEKKKQELEKLEALLERLENSVTEKHQK